MVLTWQEFSQEQDRNKLVLLLKDYQSMREEIGKHSTICMLQVHLSYLVEEAIHQIMLQHILEVVVHKAQRLHSVLAKALKVLHLHLALVYLLQVVSLPAVLERKWLV